MVLIDTHALIWALYEPSSLTSTAREAIMKNDCVISIASLWEMSIKIAKGQLILKDTIVEIADRCLHMGVDILPILPEDCQRIQDLPDIHKDPFDRIIIAQALIRDIPLITKDEHIWQYDDVEKIW